MSQQGNDGEMKSRSRIYSASEEDRIKVEVESVAEAEGIDLEILSKLKQADARQGIELQKIQPDAELESGTSLGLWVLLLGVLTLIAFGLNDTLQTLIALWQSTPIWAGVLMLISAAFWSAVVLLIAREVNGYRQSLKIDENHANSEQIQALLQQNPDAKTLLKTLEPRLKALKRSHQARNWVQQFEFSIKPNHTAQQVWQIYQTKVEQPLAEQAKALLTKEMKKSAALTFISPNDSFQNLILLWRSAAIMRQISRLYGLRPGVVGSLHLLKVAMQNVLAENIADMGMEALAKEMGNALSGKLFEQGGMATTASLLIYRLGNQLIRQLSLTKR